MTAYAALLRAVNVGGTGKLPMADLRAMGEACGFADVRTFIASGNLLFASNYNEADVKAALEEKLETYTGKPVPVLVRTAVELSAIVAANPFPDAHHSRHLVHFLNSAPAPDLISRCERINGERLALGMREIYVDYGEGIRHTKLKMPIIGQSTARNMNSTAKIAAMLSG